MAQQGMLQGEHVVMASQDESLTLTNLRIKYEAKNGGGAVYKSIHLPKVSAISVATKKYPALLGLAVLALLGAVVAPNTEGKVLAAGVALVLGSLYYFIKPGQLEVVSDSGASIAVPTKGLKFEEVRRFAEAVVGEISKGR